jgi:hypothetical protein
MLIADKASALKDKATFKKVADRAGGIATSAYGNRIEIVTFLAH